MRRSTDNVAGSHRAAGWMGALAAAALTLTVAAPARAEPSPLERLPYAQLLIDAGVAQRPTDELRVSVERLLSRLLIDDAHAALDRPADLHALLRLAVEVGALEARAVDDPDVARASAATGYLLHLMGFAFETRPAVREALEAVPEQVPAERRAVFEALVESVRRLRVEGGRWLERALKKALAAAPRDAALHHQRGHWLLREGKATAAAEAFALAFRVSEQPRHAIDLYDALLAANRSADAAALAKRVTRSAPALRSRLEAIATRRADLRATEAFERDRDGAGRATQLAQITRYWRLELEGAAILLARELETAHPNDPEVMAAVAPLWLVTRQDAALGALLARATRDGRALGERLTEVRIALAVRNRVERALGETGERVDGAHLEADLEALVARDAKRGPLIAHAARLLEPLARWRAAGRGSPEAGRAAEEATALGRAALAELPRSVDARLLALVGYIGVDAALEGARVVEGALEGLSRGERLGVEALIAQIRLGTAARTRDAEGVAAARRQLDGLASAVGKKAPAGLDEAAWRYARAVAPVVEEVLGGGAVSEAAARAALAGLPAAWVAVDLETRGGQLLEGALAATRGALLVALDEGEPGARALSRARRWLPEEPLARIAAAQAQLIAGDLEGAWELLGAVRLDTARPTEAFATHDWLGRCADAAGDAAERRVHAAALLRLWDAARMPAAVAPRSLLPLFVGDFDVGVVVVPGEALRVTLRAAPVVALLPAAPVSREEVEALLRAAP